MQAETTHPHNTRKSAYCQYSMLAKIGIILIALGIGKIIYVLGVKNKK